jgi:hypothetical protein
MDALSEKEEADFRMETYRIVEGATAKRREDKVLVAMSCACGENVPEWLVD